MITSGPKVVIDHLNRSTGVILALAPRFHHWILGKCLLFFGRKAVVEHKTNHTINGIHYLVNLNRLTGGGRDVLQLQVVGVFVLEVDVPK